MEYLLHLAIFICFYTLLAQSLNLAAGKTGLVSLAHAVGEKGRRKDGKREASPFPWLTHGQLFAMLRETLFKLG